MAWRLAKSLETLRSQVNAAYPNRSKVSDGTIGDSAHAAVASDHNPNSSGVVCALDLTHDPAHGFDAHKTADIILAHRHSNLKYLISNSRIAGAWTGWKWQRYYGSNPHDKHIHISVGVGDDGKSQPPYDSTTNWVIKENNMLTTRDNAIWLWRTVRFKHSPTDAEKLAWTGKDLNKLLTAEYATAAFQKRKEAIQSYAGVVVQNKTLSAENATLKARLAEDGDASKWQQLKVLLGIVS